MDDSQNQSDTDDSVVKDAEIVRDSSSSANGQVDVLMSLESLIKTNIIGIDKLQIELKKHREMLEDTLENDPVYKEHARLVKEATKVKSGTKSQILKQPAVAGIHEKVKNFAADLKDKKLALSDYLREYQRLSNLSEIQLDDGDVREIVNVPKLVRKKS